jgi:hypothetical protein
LASYKRHDLQLNGFLRDISKRTLLATFAAPGNTVFQILPVGLCSLQEDIIHAPVDDIDKNLQVITVGDLYRKNVRVNFVTPPRQDIAVWVLISCASVAEYQHDLQAKVHSLVHVLSCHTLIFKKKTHSENCPHFC